MVLEYEVVDRIATVRFNRPEQMNAMNLEMRVAMAEAWTNINNDPDVWLAIVTGNGKVFSAGGDLKEKLSGAAQVADPGSTYELYMNISKPTIAAINGHCLAQGAGFALLSDIRIAAEHAELGWPQVKHGLSSVSGPTLLCRSIPENIAFEYLFTGERITAQRALELGLVNRVVPAKDVMSTALDFANRILENAPLSIRGIKKAARLTRQLGYAEAFAVGRAMIQEINSSADAKEGMTAFFEKRRPTWTGS